MSWPRTRTHTLSAAAVALAVAGATILVPSGVAAPTSVSDWEPLVLEPGVDEHLAQPDTWTLDITGMSRAEAQEAAEGLSTRLYGPDRPALHSPLTISMDLPEDLVIGFRVSAVSLRGATLQASVTADGTTTNGEIIWEPASSTIHPDTIYYADVPAGPSQIQLLNAVAPDTGTTAVVIPEYWIVSSPQDFPSEVTRAPLTDPYNPDPWRSALYPEDWEPVDAGGSADGEDRFLHDFSYAGYHRGEEPVPVSPPGQTYNVTAAPYHADPTGAEDSTAAIQAAIDDAGAAGGGVVFLPPGTYRVAPPADDSPGSLLIHDDGVVLRGAGAEETRLFNDAEVMRLQSVIDVAPEVEQSWHEPVPGSTQALTQDAPEPTRTFTVADTSGFSVGDHVVIRADNTDEFVAEHGMTGKWDQDLPPGIEGGDPHSHKGPTFAREIVAIDHASGSLIVDIPSRYYLLRRDNARIYRIEAPIREVGIEDLSIGMRQNTTPGTGVNDYQNPGTGAYQMHRAAAIRMSHVMDGWVRRVESYRPDGNDTGVHLLSHGIDVFQTRRTTVSEVAIADPQYRGAGGNGYLVRLRGSDNLIKDSTFSEGRHNVSLLSMYSTGNVIHGVTLRRTPGSSPANRLATDFHMHLALANLFDGAVLDGDFLDARYRPGGTIVHGYSTTQSVFWNTQTTEATSTQFGYGIVSRQFGHGYVIGTSGSAPSVRTGFSSETNSGPQDLFVEDWREGLGSGHVLEPQSLYLDQLHRRTGLCAATLHRTTNRE